MTKKRARANPRFATLYHSLFFPPVAIFTVILVATFFGWQAARNSLSHDVQLAAKTRADSAQQLIRQHLISYEQVLRGGVGLFRGSHEVSQDELRNYLAVFDINSIQLGVEDIGFVKVFNADELPDVQTALEEQGNGSAGVWPANPARERYASIVFLQNVLSTATTVYGFDMYSEPIRQASMLRASNDNRVTMTPRIQLLAEKPNSANVGFDMYAPYYDQSLPTATRGERQSALRGYIYASFRSETFFKSIVSKSDSESLGYVVNVQGDTPAHALYKTAAYDKLNRQAGAVHLNQPMQVYGQTWMMHYAFDRHMLISDVQLSRPGNILFFGAFSAFLIAVIIYLLLRSRSRDFHAQQERAVELAKDELLSLASHQLRTPATGVKQYVGMVLQGFAGNVPANQRKLLEKAYASNDRQLRIINEILHLAKIDSGRIVLAKQETDLNDLVADIVNEQRPDIGAAKHHISVSAPKQPLLIRADVHMLRMAIENLLSNAIKYTPSGGRIAVKTFRRQKRAIVTVSDTGVGIRAEDMSKVFRQFSRLENEMSQQVGGTGIGLYLAKHLVELHGGIIEVSSKPGKGSTFTVSLPLH